MGIVDDIRDVISRPLGQLLLIALLIMIAVTSWTIYASLQEAYNPAFAVIDVCQVLDLGRDGTLDVVACPEGQVFRLGPFGP